MGSEFLDRINGINRIIAGGNHDQITKFAKFPEGKKVSHGLAED
jgi:hypothetical protein